MNLLISKNAINTKDGRLTKSDLNKLKKGTSKASSIYESKNIKSTKKKKSARDEHRVSYKLVLTHNDLT